MKTSSKNIILLCVVPLICAFILSVVIYKVTNFPAPFTFFVLICILAAAFLLTPQSKRKSLSSKLGDMSRGERSSRRPPAEKD